MATKERKDIFYVKPPYKEGGKAYWMLIGTCWVNKDGSLTPKFDVIPPSMDNIVIRDHVEKESKGDTFE